LYYFRFPSLLFIAALFGAAADAGTLRIALLAETQVQGDTVLLANFFPPGAPPLMRAAAEAISLGAAPQSGSVRRFSRDLVSAALQNAGLSPEMFLFPEVFTAHRNDRVLTRDEAFAAIQSALARNGNARIPQFHEEDLNFDSEIEVPQGTAGLEVTQMSFDPALARARFRLWPRAARGTLPFIVTARLSTQSSAPAISPVSHQVAAASPNTVPFAAPVLVDPRRLARLHLHSQNSDMLLVVRPLQPGRLNDTIPVRLASTGKTFQARVLALNYLDAPF
jgi:hypothetical protein